MSNETEGTVQTVERAERVEVSRVQMIKAYKAAETAAGGRPNKNQLHEAWISAGLCTEAYEPNQVANRHQTLAKKMKDYGVDIFLENLSRGRRGFDEEADELLALAQELGIAEFEADESDDSE